MLLGLVVGLPLGAKFLSGADKATLVRIADVRTETADLLAEADALAELAPTSLEGAMRWRTLADALAATQARAAGLPEGDERAAVESRLAALAARLPAPVAQARGERSPRVGGAERHRPHGHHPAARRERAGARSVLAPERPASPSRLGCRSWSAAGPAPVVDLEVALPQGGVPPDMIYVPAGPPAPDEPPVGAFFLSVSEVTCVEYAEWLDELEAEAREQRTPPEGFVPDPNLPGRYLAAPEFEDRPVLGITPEDAAAYAAWRAEIYGVPVRLPTAAEWRRAAGGAMLDPENAAYFRPLTESGGTLRPDLTPYGALGLLTDPAGARHDRRRLRGPRRGTGRRRPAVRRGALRVPTRAGRRAPHRGDPADPAASPPRRVSRSP